MLKKLVIAHRGAKKAAPENTLEAFQKAIELCSDMIELDVRRSPEGEIVLKHGPVKKHEKLPTLRSVLEQMGSEALWDIEIKDRHIERAVLEVVNKYLEPAAFVVTSYSDSTVKFVQSQYPQLNTGLIVGPTNLANFIRLIRFLLNPIRYLRGCTLLVIHRSLYRLNFLNLLPFFKGNVYVFTVNNEALMKKLLRDQRVTGIITDMPDKLTELQG